MKTKETSLDISKKHFYENLKKRKGELEAEIQAAKEARSYDEFEDFERDNYEWRFLLDTLGPVRCNPQGQWDYCDLIHLPKLKWTDSDNIEHIRTFIGVHTPGYYGLLAAGNISSADNSIDVTVIEPNESESGSIEDERRISIQINPEVVQTVLKNESGYAANKYLKVVNTGTAEQPVLKYQWTNISVPIVENVLQWDPETKKMWKGEEGSEVYVNDIKLADKTILTRFDEQKQDIESMWATLNNKIETEKTDRKNEDIVLDNKISNKIDLLGNEQYSGEPYHFPFNFDAKLEDNKIKVHLDTITLDNNKTRVSYDKELALPVIDVTKAYVDEQDAKKIDLLGSVPGHTDLPYNLPYFFETSADSEKVTVTAKTISLDNKKTQGEYSLDVPSATATTAGLMSASDKTKLDEITPGSMGKVDDVKVDGTSVVTDKIANIDLSVKQNKVHYGSTAPTDPKENDIWFGEE